MFSGVTLIYDWTRRDWTEALHRRQYVVKEQKFIFLTQASWKMSLNTASCLEDAVSLPPHIRMAPSTVYLQLEGPPADHALPCYKSFPRLRPQAFVALITLSCTRRTLSLVLTSNGYVKIRPYFNISSSHWVASTRRRRCLY